MPDHMSNNDASALLNAKLKQSVTINTLLERTNRFSALLSEELMPTIAMNEAGVEASVKIAAGVVEPIQRVLPGLNSCYQNFSSDNSSRDRASGKVRRLSLI